MPGVSVIIPNWNGAALLREYLPCVRAQEQVEEIIVVDNASADDSAQAARQSGARVIALEANAGFAAAVNRGLASALREWVLVLNNDVAIGPGWLRTLLETALAQSAWFATGKLLDAVRRDRIDGTYDAICRGACSWRCGAGRPDGPHWNLERTIRMAPLTALLARKALFERVGPLEETFESYLEDADFGIRCAINGLSGVYVPSAVAYHRGSATLGRWHPDTVRRIARNQVLIVARHYPAGWVWRCGWNVLVAQALWGALAFRHGRGWSWTAGKLEGIGRYRTARSPGGSHFYSLLESSEEEIRAAQSKTGFDWYWKLYFALT